MTPKQVAAQFIAICNAGFKNEFEWQGWWRKHAQEIHALPIPLRRDVVVAHGNATAKEFSEVHRKRLSRRPDGPDSGAGTSIPKGNAND